MDVSRQPPAVFLTEVRTCVPRRFAASHGLATLGNWRLPERTMAILDGLAAVREHGSPLASEDREGWTCWTVMAEAQALNDCLEPTQVALGKEP